MELSNVGWLHDALWQSLVRSLVENEKAGCRDSGDRKYWNRSPVQGHEISGAGLSIVCRPQSFFARDDEGASLERARVGKGN